MYKKKIALLLVCIMCFSMIAPTFSAPHWAQNEIDNWVSKGWIKWYEQRNFNPNENISRAEFTSLINSAFGFYQPSYKQFSDVSSYAWYSNDVKIGVSAGYINGYSETMFAPNANIKREDVATIISRLLMYGEQTQNSSMRLSDYSQISNYAKIPISQMIENKIMSGYGNQTFKPKNFLTKAEAIVLLDRILGKKIDGNSGDLVKKTILSGNYYLENDGTTLNNIILRGNLIVTGALREGSINIVNSDIQGNLFVYGGGSQSIHLDNSRIKNMRVNKKGMPVNIAVETYTNIEQMFLKGNVFIEELGDKEQGIQNIKILEGCNCKIDGDLKLIETMDNAEVSLSKKTKVDKISIIGKDVLINTEEDTEAKELEVLGELDLKNEGIVQKIILNENDAELIVGKFIENISLLKKGTVILEELSKVKNISINKSASGSRISTDKQSEIDFIEVNAEADIEGLGRIRQGNINSLNVWFEQKPDSYQLASNIVLSEQKDAVSTGDIKVERIVIRSDQSNWHEVAIGESISYYAEVYPANASKKEVEWDVLEVGGEADINSYGKLYPKEEGSIWIQAVSTDGSEIKAQELINIKRSLDIKKVDKIVLRTQNNDDYIKPGETIKIEAKIYPSELEETELMWYVINKEGRAEITQTGELTGILAGEVDIVAVAQDGSGSMGKLNFDIRGTNDTLRPNLFGLSSESIMKGASLNISSSEVGKIYLVPSDTPANLNAFLDRINLKLGLYKYCEPNEVVTFNSANLEGGDYVMYAVDRTGNISEPSPIIKIEELDQRVFVKNIYDANVYNDVRDLSVEFIKPEMEEKIEEYRLYIIPNEDIAEYSKDDLEALSKDRFVKIVPKGQTIYVEQLTSEVVDVDGREIEHEEVYRIIIISIPKDLDIDVSQMSLPSKVLIPNFKDTSIPDDTAPIIVFLRKDGDSIIANINENSELYFVKAGTGGSLIELQAAVNGGNGIKQVFAKDVEQSFDVSELESGLYIAYAADEFGNISVPSRLIDVQNVKNSAKIIEIKDINLNNDITDIVVVFEKAPDESIVEKYSIVAVPSYLADVFDLESVQAMDQTVKQTVDKNNQEIYNVQLNSNFVDIGRSQLETGQEYKIFIYTEAFEDKSDDLSEGVDVEPNYLDNVLEIEVSEVSKTYAMGTANLQAKISVDGTLYLVPYAIGNTFEDIQLAASNPNAVRSVKGSKGESVSISLSGLVDDEYKLILTDSYNNISEPSDKIYYSSVQNTVNVTNITPSSGKVTVEFAKAPNENNVFGYKVIVVPKAEVDAGFTYQQKIAVSDINSKAVSKTGANSYTVEILNTSKDSNGNTINAGVQYTVFVISIPDGLSAKVMQVSEGANYTPIN